MSDRIRVYHPEGGASLTKQAPANEVDINKIVDRYIAHGVPLPVDGRPPRYGDFTGTPSFHEAMNKVIQAEQDFLALPAHIRDYCQNDPGRFLDLVHDLERKDELVKLGLLPEQTPEPPAAPAPPEPNPETTPEP